MKFFWKACFSLNLNVHRRQFDLYCRTLLRPFAKLFKLSLLFETQATQTPFERSLVRCHTGPQSQVEGKLSGRICFSPGKQSLKLLV